jgi:probable phosphoglycerate mutase
VEGLPDDPVHGPRRGARRRSEDLLSRRIVLLRHGRTGDNAAGRVQGQRDTALDAQGRAQAEAVAGPLAALRPVTLLTSDLSRAVDTARPVARATGLEPVLDARLRELHLGSWQGLTSEQARERFPQEHADWRAGRDVPRGGGETYSQAAERAVECLVEHLPESGTLLAVTHGGTARAAIGRLLDLPVPCWGSLAGLDNTCWSVVAESGRGWRLERHGVGLDLGLGPDGSREPGHQGVPAGGRPL